MRTYTSSSCYTRGGRVYTLFFACSFDKSPSRRSLHGSKWRWSISWVSPAFFLYLALLILSTMLLSLLPPLGSAMVILACKSNSSYFLSLQTEVTAHFLNLFSFIPSFLTWILLCSTNLKSNQRVLVFSYHEPWLAILVRSFSMYNFLADTSQFFPI